MERRQGAITVQGQAEILTVALPIHPRPSSIIRPVRHDAVILVKPNPVAWFVRVWDPSQSPGWFDSHLGLHFSFTTATIW